jgi:hypothetical protein
LQIQAPKGEACKFLVATKPLPISLNVFNVGVRVESKDSSLLALLTANYGQMQKELAEPYLDYVVGRSRSSGFLSLRRSNGETLTASDESEFLFLFDKDLTVELQRRRCDLYFVHSAVLEFRGEAVMLVAASGGAKSVTAWALSHHGFGYLSDELAPVDLNTLEVQPYHRALCLKTEPPDSYPLPQGTLRVSRTLHIPLELLRGGVGRDPVPIGAIFFLFYQSGAPEVKVEPLGKAEAAARLVANALNSLAHTGEGLDGALKIAAGSVCFKLFTADLPSTCSLVKSTLRQHFGAKRNGKPLAPNHSTSSL